MPRSKNVKVPIVFGDGGAAATRGSRAKKILTELRKETGDPWEDGEIWLARIAKAREARANRRNGERDWRRYYRWFEGQQWNDRGGEGGNLASDNPRDTATVNKTGSIINSFVPFTINDEIKFLCEAEKPTRDNGIGVKIQQGLLNYEWRTQNMTQPAKECALDFYAIGHCVGKVGYTVEVDESKLKNDVINYADYVIQDKPYFERVDPLNFLFDVFGKDRSLRTARWCSEFFFVPYVDVLSNKSYDRETLGMLYSGDAALTTQSAWELQIDGKQRNRKQMPLATLPEDRLVTLIEIWDWKYKKRFIMADGCKRPLLVEDWPYDYLKKFPYAMATLIKVPSQPYGLGVPAWIEDQQLQLNRMATLEQDVARKSRPRYAASDGMNPEEVEKFKDGDDIVVGEIKPLAFADLSQGFQIIRQNIERAIEEMTGADALLQGSRLPSRTTAGEIGTRARLTGLKLDQHVEDFEEFIEEIATQVLKHLKKFRTTDDVIKVVGDEGADWIQYSNEDIQDDVEVDVEYFAAPKTDPELEKAQRKEILQLAVSALPVLAERGLDLFDMKELLGWVLDAYGEKDIGRFFRSAPTVGGAPSGGMGPGSGLPPELAGQLAPGQFPQQPGVGAPGEGLSVQDQMQGIRGLLQ